MKPYNQQQGQNLVGRYGYQMDNIDLRKELGIDGKLPEGALAPRFIGNVVVWVRSKRDAAAVTPGSRRPHRVMCVCPADDLREDTSSGSASATSESSQGGKQLMEYEIRTFSVHRVVGPGHTKKVVLHRVIKKGNPQQVFKESTKLSDCQTWLAQHQVAEVAA